MDLRLYDSYSLTPSGMVSEHTFRPPLNGRYVRFVFPNGDRNKDIYVCIDNELSRFDNNTQMFTPIRGMELFLPRPHSASAIVVNKTQFPLEPMELNTGSITLSPCYFLVSPKFRSSLQCDIHCIDSDLLIKDYCNGLVEPEKALQRALKLQFETVTKKILSAYQDSFDPVNISRLLPALSPEIIAEALARVSADYPWAEVKNVDFSLTLENPEEVTEPFIAIMKQPFLTPELIHLLIAYINSQPNISNEEIRKILETAQALQLQYPIRIVEQVLKDKLKTIPVGGTFHGRLL